MILGGFMVHGKIIILLWKRFNIESISLSLSLYIYIYIYICIERERFFLPSFFMMIDKDGIVYS